MADFFNLLNPTLWILTGLALVVILFVFITFKWLLGRK